MMLGEIENCFVLLCTLVFVVVVACCLLLVFAVVVACCLLLVACFCSGCCLLLVARCLLVVACWSLLFLLLRSWLWLFTSFPRIIPKDRMWALPCRHRMSPWRHRGTHCVSPWLLPRGHGGRSGSDEERHVHLGDCFSAYKVDTGRIIPDSKSLITMISKSPINRVVPLPNGLSWLLYTSELMTNHKLTNWDGNPCRFSRVDMFTAQFSWTLAVSVKRKRCRTKQAISTKLWL